ncbi:MAG: pyridoxal phosphate-dependent aminotransferase, partial [Pirellulales bacterium]|nr:pyridoxal phosphate-dependent aminotransferase [Pirellulales bacterium]
RDFLRRGFSRRDFGRIAALLGAGAALPFYGEAALAQLSQVGEIPPDAVKINANENPLGPCPQAIEAIQAVLAKGGRYCYDLTDKFKQLLAAQEGLDVGQVAAFAGSSAPLTQAVLAFTSPTKSFVTADPGYEAGELAARFIGAKTHRVPLTKSYAHDVKAMAAADPNAGLIYVCNPNNPTGTLTSDADIDWLVDNLPPEAVLLLDEAYIHIAGARPRSDLVRSGKRVVLLRTFSKIYGMAGLRAGAAIASPELLARITPYSSGAMPITGMVAATASLKADDLVPTRRRIIADTRSSVFQFLDRHGFAYVPSVSNKFMVDVGQPGEKIVLALRKEKVYVGRVWPSWPTHVRVTIGTPEEMEKFQAAFLKVMA